MKQRDNGHQAVTGFGWQMPVRRMPFNEAMALLGRDLHVARQQVDGDKRTYFSNKARLIQDCIQEHQGRKTKEEKEGLLVGYAPGCKYPYRGLPVEVAINVDRAIIEVIDLIASCTHVAMTGACCAGHPSKQIANSYPRNSVLANEPQLYAQNFSPYFNIMLPADDAGKSIVDMLCGIRTETTVRGRSIGIEAQINGTGRLFQDMMMLPMTGVPTLHFTGPAPDYLGMVSLYQHALADFWRAVAAVFETATGERVNNPKPDHFVYKKNVEADVEFALTVERRARGMALPNYLYFNAITGVTKPVAE